ncbi:MAG: AGE family epimerase/isomerase [Bacteroidota bacterium]
MDTKDTQELTLRLKQAATQELEDILFWWCEHMVDEEHGGFYGRIDGKGKLHPDARKMVILNTRILWTFSAADRLLPNQKYRRIADRAYQYVVEYFWDTTHKGFYWCLDTLGNKIAGKKQVYAQAFAIYALSEYFLLTQNQDALDLANQTFSLIETHSRDQHQGGYMEAFDEQWGPLEDLRLGEHDQNEAKTMNTHLHILEAYSNLFLATQDPLHKEALTSLLQLFLDRFISPLTLTQTLFFDENWQPKSQTVSFGHDIECSWLLWEGVEYLKDELWDGKTREIVIQMAREVLIHSLDPEGGIFYEKEANGHISIMKDWWPQAEAVVGFVNAFQLTNETNYLRAAAATWNFIQSHLKDPIHGEWYWGTFPDGTPNTLKDKAGPWKAPYHNARACMEVMKRL